MPGNDLGGVERALASDVLCDAGVKEAVMESTAQYWRPLWMELEPHMRVHLAQAQSNKAPKGRKSDMGDAKRLVRRFVAGELMLSFVPDPEQRTWRMITRGRLQLIREKVQVQNQIESLLEEGRIKLSSVISDLLSLSGRRILGALSLGETNPETLAALGDERLKCGREVLVDALTGAMGTIHCKLLAQHLKRIELMDKQIEELNKLSAAQMQKYQDTVVRLIEVPGIGAEAAQEIIAEIGPEAAAFPSAAQLSSCPWESARAPTRAPDRITFRFSVGQRPCKPIHAAVNVLLQSAQAGCAEPTSSQRECLSTPSHPSRICQGNLGYRSSDVQAPMEDSASGSQIHRVRRSHKPEGGKALH